jgi:hypothetical protein
MAASPKIIRTSLRTRRLRGPAARGGEAAPLAWAELRDLATDYGVRPEPSETARAYAARLRGSPALRPAQAGLDKATPETAEDSAHRAAEAAVRDLASAFEHHQYGRPTALGQPDATAGGSPAPTAAAKIATVRKVLRRNAGLLGRLRAEWLPPSVTSRWRRIAGTPFQAVGRFGAKARRAVAGSWNKARDGLRRLREG